MAWDETQNGGFFFVLRPGPFLARVPHTFVGFLRTGDDPAPRAALQRDLVRDFPNVSTIDVRAVVAAVRAILDDITLGITVVGAITLGSGVLILVGAVAMTKFQRLYEAAIYRTLGRQHAPAHRRWWQSNTACSGCWPACWARRGRSPCPGRWRGTCST